MRSILLLTMLFLALMLSAGCATRQPFQDLPQAPGDFTASYEELKQRYPEIARHESRFPLPVNMPLLSDLMARWGEPDAVKTQWSFYYVNAGILAGFNALAWDLPWGTIAGIYGVALALVPGPPQTQLWLKDRHCIEVVTNRGIIGLYRRRILFWRWSDVYDDDQLSDECKALVKSAGESASHNFPQ